MKPKLVVVLGLCGLSCVFTAAAQTSGAGTVTVNVLDPTGAVVPQAAVQLKDLGTNNLRQAETQSNGTYSYPDLPFGLYELTVSKEGFETQVFQSVQVQTGRVTTVNVTLKVGGTTQRVVVTDTAAPAHVT